MVTAHDLVRYYKVLHSLNVSPQCFHVLQFTLFRYFLFPSAIPQYPDVRVVGIDSS